MLLQMIKAALSYQRPWVATWAQRMFCIYIHKVKEWLIIFVEISQKEGITMFVENFR